MPDAAFAPPDDDRDYQTEIDQLLNRLETEALIPGRLWGAISDTVAHLADAAGDFAGPVTVAYLKAVARRGDTMFPRTSSQATLDGTEPDDAGDGGTRRRLACPCGGRTRPAVESHDYGRYYLSAGCVKCGQLVVLWREPEPKAEEPKF